MKNRSQPRRGDMSIARGGATPGAEPWYAVFLRIRVPEGRKELIPGQRIKKNKSRGWTKKELANFSS